MWVNIIVALSNLYALRVVNAQIQQKNFGTAFVFFMAMTCSFIFHLFETDEVSSAWKSLPKIPMRQSALSGMFGESQPMPYNFLMLYMDRIFAVCSLLAATYQFYRITQGQTNGKRMRRVTPQWNKLLFHSILAILVTLLSECMPNPILYCIVHSLWHFIAFQMAYDMCHLPPSRYCSTKHQYGFQRL